MGSLRWVMRAGGLVATGAVLACVGAPPPPPVDGDTSTGEPVGASTSVADPTVTPASESSTIGPGPTTEADSGSTGPSSSSTGPGCVPGQEGCACDDGMCNDGSTCVEDTCVVLLCGNGEIDVGEDCDDANAVDSDGCDGDCTISAGASEVIAGDEHVCALFHTGDIKCWGAFDFGRLGYLGQAQDIGDDETPADMPFVNVGAAVEQLALGFDFTCALLQGGDVVCWGQGAGGRLGQGSTDNLGVAEDPADIPAIDLGGPAVHIAAGTNHACAVLESGELRCWGRFEYGQLGLPGAEDVGDDEVPSDWPAVDLGRGIVAEQVAAGNNHTCALLGGGGVLCWGRDNIGQLGTPENSNTIGDDEYPAAAQQVLLPERAVLIAGRYDHTCVAYDTDTLQCWGDGGAGRLGYGDTNSVGDDEDLELVPVIDLVGSAPTSFGMGNAHTCVRVGTTQIYCWGEGDNGRLGYGDAIDSFAPSMDQLNLALPYAPRMVTAGREFSCATTEGSEVKCWGRNNRGQLGYGLAWTTDLADDEPIDSVGAVQIE